MHHLAVNLPQTDIQYINIYVATSYFVFSNRISLHRFYSHVLLFLIALRKRLLFPIFYIYHDIDVFFLDPDLQLQSHVTCHK